jgi:hypothetical protein
MPLTLFTKIVQLRFAFWLQNSLVEVKKGVSSVGYLGWRSSWQLEPASATGAAAAARAGAAIGDPVDACSCGRRNWSRFGAQPASHHIQERQSLGVQLASRQHCPSVVFPHFTRIAFPVVDFLCTSNRCERCSSDGDCYPIQFFHDFPLA